MRVCARRKAPSPRGCCLLAALLALCAGSAAAAPPGEAAFGAVDPFIGTGGAGHPFPGAVVPFGIASFKLAGLSLAPFGKTVVKAGEPLPVNCRVYLAV